LTNGERADTFSNLFSSFANSPLPFWLEEGLTQVSAESLRALLNSFRRRVEDARRGDFSRIKLAALIWAGEEYLYRKGEVEQSLQAEILVPVRSPVRSLKKAGKLLASLGDDPSATQLFRALAKVLSFLDSFIDPNTLLDESDQEIALESLQEGPPVLRGTVQVWLREPPLLKRLRDRQQRPSADEPGHQAMKYFSLTRSQLRCLSFYLTALDRPDVMPVPNRIERERDAWQPLALNSAKFAEQGDLRIALCPLQGPWRPQFQLVEGDEETNFVALPQVKEGEALRQHLDTILEEVQRRRIHILVFPELSLDEDTRCYLAERLRNLRPKNPLLAVITGSFHVWQKERTDLQPFNQAVVWDGRGQPLWEQRKQGRFRLESWQIALPQTRAFFPAMKVPPAGPVTEGIRRGGELAVVETALGRLALLICADALEDEQGYVELAGRVQADLVFIVAMTPKTKQFDEARSRFVKEGIGVILVNTACTCRAGHKHTGEMALIDLSLQESGDLPPTRWRWRIGADPEWLQHRSSEERGSEPQAAAAVEAEGDAENWQPLNNLPVREGEEERVGALLDDGRVFVLNLGHFFRGFSG
jgi:predicted amidohydrolase